MDELLKRIEAASGPPDAVTAAQWASLAFSIESEEWRLLIAALRGSIDAALALVERRLPGCGYEIIAFENKEAGVQVCLADEMVDGKTTPLAILAALLRAEIASAEAGTSVSAEGEITRGRGK